jgi:hypothetical protein
MWVGERSEEVRLGRGRYEQEREIHKHHFLIIIDYKIKICNFFKNKF